MKYFFKIIFALTLFVMFGAKLIIHSQDDSIPLRKALHKQNYYIDTNETQDVDFRKFIEKFSTMGYPFQIIWHGQNDKFQYIVRNEQNRPIIVKEGQVLGYGPEFLDAELTNKYICKGEKKCLYDVDWGTVWYFPAYQLQPNGKYRILIFYKFSADNSYILSTYNLQGKKISSLTIAGFSAEDRDYYEMNGEVNQDLQITTKKFKKYNYNPSSDTCFFFYGQEEIHTYLIDSTGFINIINSSISDKKLYRILPGGKYKLESNK